MKWAGLLIFFSIVFVLLCGCVGSNDDAGFKNLVEQLNQKGLQMKDKLKNADGSVNKAAIEDIINTYNDARAKMTGMKLSDTYAGARDNYIKGIDEAVAGYSALLKTDTGYVLGAYKSAETAVQHFTTSQSYIDTAKRLIGIEVT